MHFLHCKTQPLEFCSDMFLLPLGFPNTVESIDLSTNAYVKYPCPIPPPPRTSTLNQGFPKDSYLNNIIDVKNPLLNTLTLKNQLDQKEQSYYEILVNRLEFNNNEYVSLYASDLKVSRSYRGRNIPSRMLRHAIIRWPLVKDYKGWQLVYFE